MEAGERDRRITIQKYTEVTVGDSGFPAEPWTTLATVFARKEDISGRERYIEGQLSAPAMTRWEVHYRADIDPDLVDVPKVRRVLYHGRIHDIVSASTIDRKEGIEFITLVKEG
jgi:SPP1 family predicted phage head-tail adaptor